MAADSPPFESDALCLEFLYSELSLNREQGADDVVEAIHSQITTETPEITDEISAVQFWPDKRFPKKVFIFLSSQRAKDVLKARGIDLFGGHINFDEPGAGIMRIEMQNILYSIPHYVFKDWLAQYGDVIEIKHDQHKLKNGRRITWGTGVRHGFVKHVHTKIPPHALITYKGKNIQMRVWYYGITDTFCRFCRTTVPKGSHSCNQAPRKKCYKCRSEGHLQNECPFTTASKLCFKCNAADHIAAECPNSVNSSRNNPANRTGLTLQHFMQSELGQATAAARAMHSAEQVETENRVMNPYETGNGTGSNTEILTLDHDNYPLLPIKVSTDIKEIPLEQRTPRRERRMKVSSAKEEETGITASILEAKQKAKTSSSQDSGQTGMEVESTLTSSDEKGEHREMVQQEGGTLNNPKLPRIHDQQTDMILQNLPMSLADHHKIRLSDEVDEDSFLSAAEEEEFVERKMKGLKIDDEDTLADDEGGEDDEEDVDEDGDEEVEEDAGGEEDGTDKEDEDNKEDENKDGNVEEQENKEENTASKNNKTHLETKEEEENALSKETRKSTEEYQTGKGKTENEDSPDSFDMDMGSTDEEDREIETVIVGTSNCEGIDLFITGNDKIRVNTTNMWKSGLKMRQSTNGFAERLSTLNPLCREDTDFVVSHGGNCDLPVEGGTEELDNLANRMELELHSIMSLFPKSELIISGIPPRYGDGMESINEQIKYINERLEKFATDEDKAYFANNYSQLTKDGVVQAGFYKLDDPTGVHLNIGGKEEIARVIMNQINLAVMVTRQKKGWGSGFNQY